MMIWREGDWADQRVRSLLALYGDPRACAADLLCDRHDPSAIAYRLIGPDLAARDLTFGDLRAKSESLAAGMAALGVGAGDRVATLLGKGEALLVTLVAIWRLGAVHVPLFTAFAAPAIAMRMDASGTRLVVCDAIQRLKLAPGSDMAEKPPWRIVTTERPEPGDVAFDSLLQRADHPPPAVAMGGDAPFIQIYTSGTTGAPKGVIVPLRALAGFHAYAEFGLGLEAGDLFWNAADPGWGYGLYFGILAVLATGVPGILLEGGFSPQDTLRVLERYEITNFAAAPTVYRALRASGLTPALPLALRRASSAGEPLTPEVNDWAADAIGVLVHDHYGQTEAGMMINNHHHPRLRRPLKSGSMGHAMPGWSAAVLTPDSDTVAETGEMGRLALDLGASPLAWFDGYVAEPIKSAEKFTADGRWYLTGDVVRCDAEGYFHFASRDDDVIIMAGYRIGPSEVEAAILAHPAVAECAVVAARDEVRGEVLEAVVVLQPGHRPSEDLTKDIQRCVKSGLAAHLYPRAVHYVETLPRTPSGKIQRFLIRQQLRDTKAGAATVAKK